MLMRLLLIVGLLAGSARPAMAQSEIDGRAILIMAAAGVTAWAVMKADDAGHAKLAWTTHRKAADWLSTGTVAGGLMLACLPDDRTRHCFKWEAVRVGAVIGITEATKHWVHRDRPDQSDRKSFFSEHTALACAGGLTTKRQAAGIALCAGTAYLRVASDKHWISDVAVGVGLAWALSRVR